MELETLQSSQTLTRSQRQTQIKVELSAPLFEPRLKRIIRQRGLIPSQNQPEQVQPAAEPPSTDLPPLQAAPNTNSIVINKRRKRSSSTGNDARQVPASKTATPEQERCLSPLKSRIELAPIAVQLKNNPRENYSIQLKNSIRTVELRHLQQEQIRAKNKEDLVKMSLSKVFPSDKKKDKDVRLSQSTVVEASREGPLESGLPRIRQEITPKDLVFGPNVRKDDMLLNYNNVVDGIRYAMHQVKPLPVFQIRSLQVSLKKKNEALQKTLVLDLDETLVHARRDNYDNKNLPCINGGDDCFFWIEIRPYVQEFLQEMSREFEIIVFTAAEKVYAKNILKLLDPERKYISHLLHRSHCLRTKRGVFIKDLRILLGRELKDIVIVDNFTPSFSFQVGNGIPIITWNGDPKDQELKYLIPYLLEAKKCNDMRQYNREKLRLEELGQI